MFAVGIEREQLGGELPEHVIRHDEHRLRREAEPLQFNGRGDHRVGLARADGVREQRVVALHDSPDGVLLVRAQRDLLAAAGQRQMAAVEDAQPHGVELVVVFAAEPFAPLVVLPHPRFEALLDLLHLVARGFGFRAR